MWACSLFILWGHKMRVPKILFGSTKETRSNWTKVVRRLLNTQNYAEVFEELELIDLDLHDEVIIIRELASGWTTNENVWNVNLLHSRWPFLPDMDHQSWKQQFDIVMKGLDYPWYHLGMLFSSVDFRFLRFHSLASTPFGATFDTAMHRQQILIPWLDAALSKISAIGHYHTRFRICSHAGDDPLKLQGLNWLLGILKVTVMSGLCSIDIMSGLEHMTISDVCRKLLDTGNFETTPEGLRITRPGGIGHTFATT